MAYGEDENEIKKQLQPTRVALGLTRPQRAELRAVDLTSLSKYWGQHPLQNRIDASLDAKPASEIGYILLDVVKVTRSLLVALAGIFGDECRTADLRVPVVIGEMMKA